MSSDSSLVRLTLLCCLLLASGVRAEEGIVGGYTALATCLNSCLVNVEELPAANRSPPNECNRYCTCALTIKVDPARGSSILDELERHEHRQASCKAEIWPRQFDAPGAYVPSARERKERDEAERRRVENERVDRVVEKARAADGGASLFKHEVRLLANADWRTDLETLQLRQMLFKARDEGQRVIQCTYGPTKNASGQEAFATYKFWYQSVPTAIDAMLRIDTQGALQFLGANPQAECPISDRAALVARQTAMSLYRALQPLVASTNNGKVPPPRTGKAPPPPSGSGVGGGATSNATGSVKQRNCASLMSRIEAARKVKTEANPNAARNLAALERTYARQGCAP